MAIRALGLAAVATVLFYIAFQFSIHSQAKSIEEVLRILKSDQNFRSLLVICTSAALPYLIWQSLNRFVESRKTFAQRISLHEYEMQKNTYTQVKVNELINSEAYQEFEKKRQMS